MADPIKGYGYLNAKGDQLVLNISQNKATAGGFAAPEAGAGKFGPINRGNYPWTVHGVSSDGHRVSIPLPGFGAWSEFIQTNNSFEYTNAAGTSRTYNVTGYTGEKITVRQLAT